MLPKLIFAAALFAAAVTFGVITPPPAVAQTEIATPAAPGATTGTADAAAALSATPSMRYRLQPSDVLEVQFRHTPEFNQTVTVQPDGFVALEVAGDARVEGLTVEEVRALITERSSWRLKDPVVTIVLRDFVKPYFTVAGEVLQPGKFELRDRISVLQGVLQAGGFRETAKSSQVILFRRVNAEVAEAVVLDFGKLSKSKGVREDPVLQPGDMLLVPQSTLTKVERYVRMVSLAGIFGVLR